MVSIPSPGHRIGVWCFFGLDCFRIPLMKKDWNQTWGTVPRTKKNQRHLLKPPICKVGHVTSCKVGLWSPCKMAENTWVWLAFRIQSPSEIGIGTQKNAEKVIGHTQSFSDNVTGCLGGNNLTYRHPDCDQFGAEPWRSTQPNPTVGLSPLRWTTFAKKNIGNFTRLTIRWNLWKAFNLSFIPLILQTSCITWDLQNPWKIIGRNYLFLSWETSPGFRFVQRRWGGSGNQGIYPAMLPTSCVHGLVSHPIPGWMLSIKVCPVPRQSNVCCMGDAPSLVEWQFLLSLVVGVGGSVYIGNGQKLCIRFFFDRLFTLVHP